MMIVVPPLINRIRMIPTAVRLAFQEDIILNF